MKSSNNERSTINNSTFAKWQCVSNCGACCNLDPEDRPDLAEYLSAEELDLYMSMVGEDGWCINFDHETRKCQIYEQRPRFCRVKPDTFQDMYQIPAADFNDFAIACCHQQITGIYGEDSEEFQRYVKETNSLRGSDGYLGDG